jgi:hypothetical protein
MNRELFSNTAQTTLATSAATAATTLAVVAGTVFAASGNFRVRVDDEIMLCTARTANTLTVVRGQEGTTAAYHAGGATVTQVLTEGGFQQYMRDNDPLFDSLRPPFRIIDANQNLLHAADFTLFTFGSNNAIAMDDGGSILLQQTGLVNSLLTRPITTSSWTLTTAVRGVTTQNALVWAGASIGLMDANNQAWAFNYRQFEHSCHINWWDGGANYHPNDTLSPCDVPWLDWMWLRIWYSGSGNVHFCVSDNGHNWLELGEWGYGWQPGGFTMGPYNRFFFGSINPAAAGWATLAAWDDGAGILG